MEKKRTKATDIAEIAALLDGKVDFQQILFNQVLTTEHGKSVTIYCLYLNISVFGFIRPVLHLKAMFAE